MTTELKKTQAHPAEKRNRAPWNWPLHYQILTAILLGSGIGWICGPRFPASWEGFLFFAFVGKLFMKALGMLVVPLIASSMIVAMGSIGRHHHFARLGMKTLAYYISTSLIAILIGVGLVNFTRPGEGKGLSVKAFTIAGGSQEAGNLKKIGQRVKGRTKNDIFNVISELVPSNIVDTASSNRHILGVITFSLLFGFFLSRLGGRQQEVMVAFCEAFYQIMVRMTHFVLRFLPLGVGAIMAKTVAAFVGNDTFLERLGQVSIFALTVLAGLAIQMFIVMPLVLRLLAKVSPMRHFSAMGPAILTAFSTASSSATLPLTMECVRDRAGVSRETSGFTLPLGATVNMDGTALYECVAVLFITQLYGVQMGFSEQLLVVVLALMTSIGVAGIPSASLVAIVLILNAVGARINITFGFEAIAVIMVFDRILDMCRTAVNVFGDSCGAVLIARSEGESEVLAAPVADDA